MPDPYMVKMQLPVGYGHARTGCQDYGKSYRI